MTKLADLESCDVWWVVMGSGGLSFGLESGG